MKDYDWKFRMPSERIGISLLALKRADKFDLKHEALVRPYHPNAKFSSFSIPLLLEVLEETSTEHQKLINFFNWLKRCYY